jgi:hypothetical protein
MPYIPGAGPYVWSSSPPPGDGNFCRVSSDPAVTLNVGLDKCHSPRHMATLD